MIVVSPLKPYAFSPIFLAAAELVVVVVLQVTCIPWIFCVCPETFQRLHRQTIFQNPLLVALSHWTALLNFPKFCQPLRFLKSLFRHILLRQLFRSRKDLVNLVKVDKRMTETSCIARIQAAGAENQWPVILKKLVSPLQLSGKR